MGIGPLFVHDRKGIYRPPRRLGKQEHLLTGIAGSETTAKIGFAEKVEYSQ